MSDNIPTGKEKLKEITDSIEQGIKELFQSDKYTQFLRTMSRFHKYSVNNTLLIAMQRPDATHVAGFNKWRDEFGRTVKRGEKSIKIIAPTPYKKKIEEKKLDPLTKAPLLDSDGNVLTEEKEVTIPMFKVVSVFDVSQTEGKPLPQLASSLTGTVQQYEVFMEALRRTSPVPLAVEAMHPNCDGFFSVVEQRIALRSGMSEVQTISASIHEITHAMLHNYEKARLAIVFADQVTEPPKPKDRHTEEVEAESVSYSVCAYYGIATGENSFGYIASWSRDKELPELRASLETINNTASSLIDAVDMNFREVLQEYDRILHQFATDMYEYTASVMEKPFPLHPPEEEVPFIVDLLRNGIGRDVRADILNAAKVSGAPSPDELLQRLDEIEKIFPPREPEAMFLLKDTTYMYLKETPEGHEYTLYDKTSLQETGFGFIEECCSNSEACDLAFANENVDPEESYIVSLDILKGIAAVRERDIQEYLRQNQSMPDQSFSVGINCPSKKSDALPPNTPEHMLDEYPMPDSSLTVADLEGCNYWDGDMLPLSRARAIEFLEQDFTVYAIDNGGAEMVFDLDKLPVQGGMFAVSREEWQNSQDFSTAIEDRLNHQIQREASFLGTSNDAFAIYQLKDNDAGYLLRFMPISWLESKGLDVNRDNYDLVYTAPLGSKGDTVKQLDGLWQRFNIDHPIDYHRPSLSVSDIVALKQNGVVSCHYVDSFGFQQLPSFLGPDNYLRDAEMATEDDYGMIDGITNNGKNPSIEKTAHKPGHMDKRISVLDQLASPPLMLERNKTAPFRGADKEL